MARRGRWIERQAGRSYFARSLALLVCVAAFAAAGGEARAQGPRPDPAPARNSTGLRPDPVSRTTPPAPATTSRATPPGPVRSTQPPAAPVQSSSSSVEGMPQHVTSTPPSRQRTATPTTPSSNPKTRATRQEEPASQPWRAMRKVLLPGAFAPVAILRSPDGSDARNSTALLAGGLALIALILGEGVFLALAMTLLGIGPGRGRGGGPRTA